MKADYTTISREIVTGLQRWNASWSGPLLLSLLGRQRRGIDRRAMGQHHPLYLACTNLTHPLLKHRACKAEMTEIGEIFAGRFKPRR